LVQVPIAVVSAIWSLRSRRWWTRAPFFPIPDRTYFRWRMQTAYGSWSARPTRGDIAGFAIWRRNIERYRKAVAQ
jgi:hypothetical protein